MGKEIDIIIPEIGVVRNKVYEGIDKNLNNKV